MKLLRIKTLYYYYPPRRYVFFPLYRFFRKRCRLWMWLSNLLVWWISAALHALIFIPFGDLAAAAIFGSIFIFLGLLSSVIILFSK
ncbi:hypothetical protein K8I31_01215 [bacterium]|nr:hypothetical protein [bacterium]